MNKLRLDLSTLAVESFAPRAHAARPGGTVRGHVADYSAEQTACADVCASQVATCVTCDAWCEEEAVRDRRIILY